MKITDERSSQQRLRDEALISFINSNYIHPWKRARRPYVSQYLINHAYVNGHQFIMLDNGTIVPRPKTAREVQIAHNHFRPTMRVVIGQVTKNKPRLDVRAMVAGAVPEAETIVARQVLKGSHYATGKAAVDEHNWTNLIKGGTSAIRCIWNGQGGQFGERPVRDKDNNQIFRDLVDDKERTHDEAREIIAKMVEEEPDVSSDVLFNQRFTPELEQGWLGDLQLDPYSVLEFGTDPGFWNLREADVMFVERWRSLRYIREVFGKVGRSVEPEANAQILFDQGGNSTMLPGASLTRATGQYAYQQGRDRPGGAVVREFLVKPTDQNPLSHEVLNGTVITDSDLKEAKKGVHFVWANGVVLQDEETPMPYFETPGTEEPDPNFDMVSYTWYPEPGFYGTPMLTDAVPLQNAINIRRGQIIAALSAYTHAKILMPTTANIRDDAFSNEVAEVIEFAGVPPSYLQPPTIPSHLFRALEDDVTQFNDVLMVHEVSRQGKVPAQVRTASALLKLQETDNLALAPIMLRWEGSEAELGQMMLDRTRQFYEDERLVKFVGERNKLEVGTFLAQSMNRNRWTVFVHEGSSLPDSAAAKIQLVFEMLQFAAFMFVDPKTGAPDRSKVARLLNMAAFDEFLQDQDESRLTQEWETTQLLQGTPIAPRKTDEDAVHLTSIYAVIRSPDFLQMEPEIQKLLETHAAIHEQQMFEKVQNMGQVSQRMGAAAQGAAANAQAGAQGQDVQGALAGIGETIKAAIGGAAQ